MFQKEVDLCNTGGTSSFKKKLKPLYIRTTKCPYRHKNLDYWYLLNKYSPETQNYDVFCTSWMKSLTKMRKLNNWPKCLSREEEKGLIVKDPFNITHFPFLSSNIPTSPAYGVFISQLIRYAPACSSCGCFILSATRLSNKLLEQGYVKKRLKSSLWSFMVDTEILSNSMKFPSHKC